MTSVCISPSIDISLQTKQTKAKGPFVLLLKPKVINVNSAVIREKSYKKDSLQIESTLVSYPSKLGHSIHSRRIDFEECR